MNNLIYLNLSYNKLTQIEEHDFDHMPNIQYINLDFNKITRIRNDTFNQMIKLDSLSFRFNKLTTIDSFAFKNNEKNLTELLLEGNKLKNKEMKNFVLLLTNVSRLDMKFNLI